MRYQIMVISTWVHDTCDNELSVFKEYDADDVHDVPGSYIPKIKTLFDKHSGDDEWETKIIIMAIDTDWFTVCADIGLFDDNSLHTFSVFEEFIEWSELLY